MRKYFLILLKKYTELIKSFSHHPIVLKNVFKSSFQKKALLSYIKEVFLNNEFKKDLAHTNRYTTYCLAEVLHNLGYQVDVINYDEKLPNQIFKYDIILGLGESLEQILSNKVNYNSTKVIWFGTGCNPLYSNQVTLERMTDFYRKHGKILLNSSRYIEKDWPLQHEVSDYIILHGQEFAKKTYGHPKIKTIHAPVFKFHEPDLINKNWDIAKKHFLWFGSGGLIHKGLDLVLDAFNSIDDAELHICGNLENEPEFYNYYKSVIEQKLNIHYHGFVNIKSEKFKNILNQCAFIICPSCSEGNCASVLTCMINGGLVPVVSINSDIESKYAIIIKELNEEMVINSIYDALNLDVNQIMQICNIIIEQSKKINNFDYFKLDVEHTLKNIINEM